MDGSLGSYFKTNTGRWSDIFLLTFSKATFLGICMALFMAVSMRFSGYSLARSNSLSYFSLRSLLSSFVQIRMILRAKEYGMALEVALG